MRNLNSRIIEFSILLIYNYFVIILFMKRGLVMLVTASKPTHTKGVRVISRFARITVTILLAVMVLASGCGSVSANQTKESAKTEAATVATLSQPTVTTNLTPAETSAATSTVTPPATATPTPAAQPEEIMSAPLFTYNEKTDELRAYYSTFDNGAKYYTLSNPAGKESGDYIYYTFIEFDLSIVYHFDAENSVWRIFNTMYMGEEVTAENLKDGYKCAEFVVYKDCEDAVKNQQHLDRDRGQDAPSYRQWDNVLWYSFAYAYGETIYDSRSPSIPIEINIDMNKDGTIDTVLYDVNRNLSLNGGSKTYLLNHVSSDTLPIGVYVIDVNPDDASLDLFFVFGSGAPGIEALAPSLWVRYDQGKWIIKEVPYKQVCCVKDDKITFTGIAPFFEYRYVTREFSVDKSYEMMPTDQLFPFIEKFTVIAPMDAVFPNSDGTTYKGSLKAGTKIETTKTDYMSKVYFVTSAGKEGYFKIDSNSLTGEISALEEKTYYNGCLKSDIALGYNLIP